MHVSRHGSIVQGPIPIEIAQFEQHVVHTKRVLVEHDAKLPCIRLAEALAKLVYSPQELGADGSSLKGGWWI